MLMRRIVFTLIAFSYVLYGFSQTHNLSPEALENFKARCEEIVETFQHGLEIIGSKEQEKDVKQHYKKNVLKLFMGNGENYKDADGNIQPAVKMQVSSVRYNSVISKTDIRLKEYLNRLESLPYAEVKITKAQSCVISNLYKVGNRYEGTVTIFQYFSGRRGDGSFYKDKTQKNIKVYLLEEDDGVLGKYWALKLGDIDVVETVKL